MDNSEPPDPATRHCSPLLVGRDSCGHWIVRDRKGLRGGLFVSRAEALKFAFFENGRTPHAVVMVAEALELELSAPAALQGSEQQAATRGNSVIVRDAA